MLKMGYERMSDANWHITTLSADNQRMIEQAAGLLVRTSGPLRPSNGEYEHRIRRMHSMLGSTALFGGDRRPGYDTGVDRRHRVV